MNRINIKNTKTSYGYEEIQPQNQLQTYPPGNSLNTTACAHLIADLTAAGSVLLEKHIQDYNEILLHILAGELVTEPLIALLKYHKGKENEISLYCKMIEVMWNNGDEAVKNEVDVTILERISDEEAVWKYFGTYITNEFKHDINDIILPGNPMMSGVKMLI